MKTLENKLRQHIKNLDSSNLPEQSEHSPLPWALIASKKREHRIIMADDGNHILECEHSDAAYIVKACNEYQDLRLELELVSAQRDELLAAAKAVMADTTQSKEPFPSAIVRQSSIAKLKTAIANWRRLGMPCQ